MKVSDLIELLKAYPQNLEVAYRCYSEQTILSADEIEIVSGCSPRQDGWIQSARPDMPTQEYVMFPGN